MFIEFLFYLYLNYCIYVSKFKITTLSSDELNFLAAQNQVKKLIKSKKCDFIKDQLKANIAKPSKLCKILKSLGLSSKGSTNAKVCLKENEIATFKPKETAGFFRKFYEKPCSDTS